MLFVRCESRVYGKCFGCGVRASGFVGAAGKVLNLFSVFPVLKFVPEILWLIGSGNGFRFIFRFVRCLAGFGVWLLVL